MIDILIVLATNGLCAWVGMIIGRRQSDRARQAYLEALHPLVAMDSRTSEILSVERSVVIGGDCNNSIINTGKPES